MRSVFVCDSFGIRSRFVRDGCIPACLPACMQAGSRYSYQYGTSYHEYSYSISRTRGRSYGTVLHYMYCRYGSPYCRTGCVRDSFVIRMGFVRDSFGMAAFLPASLHACRQAVGTRTSTVLHTTSIRTAWYSISRTRGRSYGTVLHYMYSRYGSPYCRTGCVRDSFVIRLGFV